MKMVNMLLLNLDGILFEVFICEAKKSLAYKIMGCNTLNHPTERTISHANASHKRHVASFIMSSRVMGLPFGHLQSWMAARLAQEMGFFEARPPIKMLHFAAFVEVRSNQNGGMETHKSRPGSQLFKVLSSCTWRNETPKRPVICTLRLVRSGMIW